MSWDGSDDEEEVAPPPQSLPPPEVDDFADLAEEDFDYEFDDDFEDEDDSWDIEEELGEIELPATEIDGEPEIDDPDLELGE